MEKEKFEQIPRLAEGERCDPESGKYPDVVHHREMAYDLRNVSGENGNAQYRMTFEGRVSREEPSYIEVDREGYVVREWD